MKIALGVMASMIVTGATAWLVFGADKVTRNEMVNYVQTQSLWSSERGEVFSTLRNQSEDIGELKALVSTLAQSSTDLLVEQRVLVTKLDAYIDGQKAEREGR